MDWDTNDDWIVVSTNLFGVENEGVKLKSKKTKKPKILRKKIN